MSSQTKATMRPQHHSKLKLERCSFSCCNNKHLSPLSINVDVVSLLRFIVKPLSKFESIMNGMMGRENHLMDVVGATKIILCIPLDLLFSSRNRWHNSRRRWFQATNRPRPAVAGIFDSPSLVLPHCNLKELYQGETTDPRNQSCEEKP